MSRHSNSCFLCLGQLSVDEFLDELTLLIAAFGPLPEAAVNECGDSSKVLRFRHRPFAIIAVEDLSELSELRILRDFENGIW